MLLANAHQIREADRRQIEDRNFPSLILMESAGMLTAQALLRDFPEMQSFGILTGPGNNGGDGLVIARHLHQAGKEVQILLSHPPERFQGDAAINYQIISEMPVPLSFYGEEPLHIWLDSFGEKPLLIDALLGTGIQSELRAPISQILGELRKKDLPVVAIDLPSGLDASTGMAINTPLKARKTYTFQVPKVCHYVTPASLHCGDIEVLDIGLWPEIMDGLGINRHVLTSEWIENEQKPRKTDSHKGTFGHVLLVGGSREMSGAMVMACRAALRSGTGLVTVLSPEDCRESILQHAPEAMCVDVRGGVLGREAIDVFDRQLKGKTAVMIGPGIGQKEETCTFLRAILPMIQVPLLLDADALNILSGDPSLWASLPDETILTPHPGEMKRLLEVDTVNQRRLEAAERLAQDKGVVVVLKGAGTLISSPDSQTFVNTTGNPGMAKGGSGDVLSGVIAAWLGQGYSAKVASALGVYLHGKAGDHAADELGMNGMTAMDIIRHL